MAEIIVVVERADSVLATPGERADALVALKAREGAETAQASAETAKDDAEAARAAAEAARAATVAALPDETNARVAGDAALSANIFALAASVPGLAPVQRVAGLTGTITAGALAAALALAPVAVSASAADLTWQVASGVNRSVAQRLSDLPRLVTDYGADPTAATDARAAAQAAVTAIPSGATGLVVWPSGTYSVSSSLDASGARVPIHRFEPGAQISSGFLGKIPWPARVEYYSGRQRATYLAGAVATAGDALADYQEVRNIGGAGLTGYGRRYSYFSNTYQGNTAAVFDIADGRIAVWNRTDGQNNGQYCTDWVVAVSPAIANVNTRSGGFVAEFNFVNRLGAYAVPYASRKLAAAAGYHWCDIIQIVPESNLFGNSGTANDVLAGLMISGSAGTKVLDGKPARLWSAILGEACAVPGGGYAIQWTGNDGTYGGAEDDFTFLKLNARWVRAIDAAGAIFSSTVIDLSGATLGGDAIATPGARLTGAGHLVWTPSTTALLTANGQAALSAPSDTSLALSLQGSDSALRSATLPLEGLIASQAYVQGYVTPLTQYVVASSQTANAWADLRVPLSGSTYRDRALTIQNNSVDGVGGRGSAAIRYLEQAAEGGAERAVIGYSSATGGYRTNSVFIEQRASSERYPAFRHYIYHAAGMAILPGATWTPMEITGDYGTINLRRNDSALALSMDGTSGVVEVSRGLRSVSPATSTAGWLEARALRGSDANGSLQRAGALYLTSYRADSKILLGASPLYSNAGIVAFGGNHTDGSTGNIAYGASIAGVQRGDFNSATDMPMGLLFRVGSAGVAAGAVNVVPGSVDAMLIDYDGKIGVGTNTPRARMHVNGGLILVPGSTPIPLTNNGEVTVTFASNTTLVFSARGTDGLPRTATLTLS